MGDESPLFPTVSKNAAERGWGERVRCEARDHSAGQRKWARRPKGRRARRVRAMDGPSQILRNEANASVSRSDEG